MEYDLEPRTKEFGKNIIDLVMKIQRNEILD